MEPLLNLGLIPFLSLTFLNVIELSGVRRVCKQWRDTIDNIKIKHLKLTMKDWLRIQRFRKNAVNDYGSLTCIPLDDQKDFKRVFEFILPSFTRPRTFATLRTNAPHHANRYLFDFSRCSIENRVAEMICIEPNVYQGDVEITWLIDGLIFVVNVFNRDESSESYSAKVYEIQDQKGFLKLNQLALYKWGCNVSFDYQDHYYKKRNFQSNIFFHQAQLLIPNFNFEDSFGIQGLQLVRYNQHWILEKLVSHCYTLSFCFETLCWKQEKSFPNCTIKDMKKKLAHEKPKFQSLNIDVHDLPEVDYEVQHQTIIPNTNLCLLLGDKMFIQSKQGPNEIRQ